ncbi:MAG TPA: histidine--tRNA ligase [Ignavibacteriaceae bacterium]|nr:histidine--tRNA ligase [Ignavibacteriaceae bacterium]
MIKAVTGTKDILPEEIPSWKIVEETVERIFKNFNYSEIRTPIFEETNLFARGIGEETDIVSKEMYTFKDRSEASLTLKPEMTASVVRAFVEHSLGKQQSLNKLYYISPMFRQERPQAGRLRQFHQFGAEAIGSDSVYLDVEMIQMSYEILKSLGLKDLTVKINSLGTPESREEYKLKLREYLSDKKEKLSEESRKRFDKNILRIFDSKDENDKRIMKDAPLILDHLDEESKNSFEIVKESLRRSDIPFRPDPYLVRGLDYYTKTTFEILSGKVGSQNALCGGGRYDFLIEQFNNQHTPAVGFAAGIERILLACENEKSLQTAEQKIDLYIIRLDDDLSQKVFDLALNFRRKNLSVECDYLNRSVKAQMREANRLKAKSVLFLGGDEYKNGLVNLKNMETGEQETIILDKLDELIISQKSKVKSQK